MDDTRLVQTAVLGTPSSTEPVYFPPEYADALDFREEHYGAKFYCGHWLGGCGGELSTRISDYFDIVPHFTHHPDGPACPYKTTYRTGGGAADHLYVHNGLIAVGTRSGRMLNARIDIESGRCGHILLHDEELALRVQFADIPRATWTDENRRLADNFESVAWISGPEALTPAKILRNRDGYALRSKCRFRGSTREVLVRTESDYIDHADWIPLADCHIDRHGVVTAPVLEQQRQLHLTAQALPTPESLTDNELRELMQPVINELLINMRDDQRDDARTTLARFREEFVLVRHAGTTHMNDQLAAVKSWVSGGQRDLTAVRSITMPRAEPVRDAMAPPARPQQADAGSRTRSARAVPSASAMRADKVSGPLPEVLARIVTRLEAAQQTGDSTALRGLFNRYHKDLRPLGRKHTGSSEMDSLRKRLLAVRLWYINNPPSARRPGETRQAESVVSTPRPAAAAVRIPDPEVGNTTAPVWVAPDRKRPNKQLDRNRATRILGFPHRSSRELDALLRATALAQRTLTITEAKLTLTLGAHMLEQFLRVIGRADLEHGAPFLAALIEEEAEQPVSMFQTVITALGYRPHEAIDWTAIRRDEVARVHTFYRRPDKQLPKSPLEGLRFEQPAPFDVDDKVSANDLL